MDKKLTKTQEKAREILLRRPGLTAGQFAKEMWPDNPKWNRCFNCGNGATKGSGMILLGGSYLWKLRKRGLVYCDNPRLFDGTIGIRQWYWLK